MQPLAWLPQRRKTQQSSITAQCDASLLVSKRLVRLNLPRADWTEWMLAGFGVWPLPIELSKYSRMETLVSREGRLERCGLHHSPSLGVDVSRRECVSKSHRCIVASNLAFRETKMHRGATVRWVGLGRHFPRVINAFHPGGEAIVGASNGGICHSSTCFEVRDMGGRASTSRWRKGLIMMMIIRKEKEKEKRRRKGCTRKGLVLGVTTGSFVRSLHLH